MSVWLDYLVIAENCLAQANEASLRNSVSRSYYALLNLTVLFIEKHAGYTIPKGQKHSIAWSKLEEYAEQSSDAELAHVASIGAKFKIERQNADYDLQWLSLPELEKLANKRVMQTKEMITHLLK